jgi:hypothetical protein
MPIIFSDSITSGGNPEIAIFVFITELYDRTAKPFNPVEGTKVVGVWVRSHHLLRGDDIGQTC